MDRRIQNQYNCMDTLCTLYWMHLSDLEVEKAHTCLKMLNIHFKSAPLEKFPYYLKKRVEIHEVLASVVQATDAELADEELRFGVFETLFSIFTELEGPDRAGDLLKDLKKSEKLFVLYSQLREFQIFCKIDTTDENSLLTLTDEEFSQYHELLMTVMRLCDVSGESFDLVEEDPSTKEEFIKIFENLGEGTFNKFNTELFNNFIRVFCHGLKYFQKILGRPKHFQESSIFGEDIDCEPVSVQPCEPVAEQPCEPVAEKPIMSSCESVNDSVDVIETGRSSFPLQSSKRRLKSRLIEEIRSRSPPKECEIMKPEGILWDDSASDVSRLSVSGSSTKRVKWSAQESKALVEGVKRYGTGQWALIRADSRMNLGHKTNVQLKDRWRNLVKNDPGLRSLDY